MTLSRPRPTSFTEDLRYQYDGDLFPDSLVIDCGGFVGDFAAGIAERYDSWIVVYEPVAQYAQQIRERFAANPKVTVVNAAVVGDVAVYGRRIIRLETNSTGFYVGEGAPEEEVEVVGIHQFGVGVVHLFGGGDIALLKLNIEGSEFDVLPRLIDTGLVRRCLNLQIQFHRCYPDADAVRDRIRERLAETHEETWGFAWAHENWRRR